MDTMKAALNSLFKPGRWVSAIASRSSQMASTTYDANKNTTSGTSCSSNVYRSLFQGVALIILTVLAMVIGTV